MQIRLYELEHTDKLTKQEREDLNKATRSSSMSPIHSKARDHIVVAKSIRDRIVAVMEYSFIRKNCKLHQICVMRKHRKRGIGKQMMNYLDIEAKKRKMQSIVLDTHMVYNAKSFYDKLGYSVVKFHDRDGYYTMNKKV